MPYYVIENKNHPGSWYSHHSTKAIAAKRAQSFANQSGKTYYIGMSKSGHWDDIKIVGEKHPSRTGNPTITTSRDNAFNAGKSWVSSAHASGVANARVVTYGFSKWFNSLSPSAHKSEGVTKATLLKDFKEGYSTAKRKKNPTITTSTLPIGEWSPAHAIRRNADGSVDILREKNSGRRANISEGFMAGGVFHPIRGASDYDASRVGEGRTYKKASTKRAMATSRRDYGGDGSRYGNAGKTRKTEDVWAVQQYSGSVHGWEDVTHEKTNKEARAQAKVYKENQPEYPVRVKLKRIPK